MNLFELSGLELAQLIREKKISPTELIEVSIQKIEKVNPMLNAVAEPLFDQARLSAKEKTEQLAKLQDTSELPIYFGVPMSVKEMLAIKGCKRTAGSIHHKNDVMDFTSTVVERMLRAGAIPLCTSNVPELGFWFETENAVYGRSNNPYDFSRTPGGSSGGEGALIGAGASPFGLGSDIGGSIRIPAAFCGVFGHKPTWKSVPLTGHFPYDQEKIKSLNSSNYPSTSIGLLSRRAKDLGVLLNILKGADEYDHQTLSKFHLEPLLTDFSEMNVFIMPDPQIYLSQRADKELQDCVRNAGLLFEQYGAKVQELNPKIFKNSLELWSDSLKSSSSTSFSEALTSGDALNIPKEFWNLFRGQPKYMFTSLVTSLLEKIPSPVSNHHKMLTELNELDLFLKKTLGPKGILILPPHPRVAPHHHAPWTTPFDFLFTAIFNVLGYPATSVPTGLNHQGLPLAVQIVSLPNCDHLTLSAAEALESAYGGWTAPAALL